MTRRSVFRAKNYVYHAQGAFNTGFLRIYGSKTMFTIELRLNDNGGEKICGMNYYLIEHLERVIRGTCLSSIMKVNSAILPLCRNPLHEFQLPNEKIPSCQACI